MRLAKPELDVGIVSVDAEATCAFYRDVMGFRELPAITFGGGNVQHRFAIGRNVVKINRFAQPPERESGGVERAIGMRLLAFLLDDLSAVLARLDAAGKRYRAVEAPGIPHRIAFTSDPEGNVLELVGLREPMAERLTNRLQVGLTVSDVARSRHFYGEQLGLREEPVMELQGTIDKRYGFVWGATTIKFWAAPGPLPVHTGAPQQRSGIRMFTAMVEDIDEAHAELVAKDVPIPMAPVELPGVARIMFMSDPDGNWIQLAQRL